MSHFLKLPLELRNIIYRHCLVMEDDNDDDDGIIPYLRSYEEEDGLESWNGFRAPIPGIGLLTVNKEISSEAKIIFYGENRWRLHCWGRYPGHISDKDQLRVKNKHLFRHVQITLDARDLHRRDSVVLINGKFEENRDPNGELQARHADNRRHHLRNWGLTLRILDGMNLISLDIEIGYMFCSIGCCRFGALSLPQNTESVAGYASQLIENESTEDRKLSRLLYSAMGLNEPLPSFTTKRCRLSDMFTSAEYERAHLHGFGCEFCPLNQEKYNTSACTWKAELENETFSSDDGRLSDTSEFQDYYDA
ncbi:uncharacterized protein KY384_000763 [Bacidia gigantensis]|uniref:uncharacterized protein n=1 Tax=Bacidia gigantensis TaxID=2732470 RepID=UPI001D03A39D|nr:uncharacterized protein KY384_000763 [Bacidia gigantensis]KAG8526001.1 hypothetical protein KY384_000763 [Bacidia gigantensis]